MGHIRLGFLPHTKQWRNIVELLSHYGGDTSVVPIIADATLKAIDNIYQKMPYDESVIKAILFLANLIYSTKQSDQVMFLNSNGYTVDDNLSIYSLTKSIQQYITTENGSLEINKIAKDATMQAVIDYLERHQSSQLDIFGNDPQSPLRRIGNGSDFCELARSFFAFFTDRHIKYFIEREAAQVINNYGDLDKFSSTLTELSCVIADHAFDTSLIMQSFAAGWFNKYSTKESSSETVIEFLRKSFAKMREEFRKEAESI